MTIVNYDTPSYNTDFPISSWQPVPRLLAAACRHLARRFFLTQPAAPAKKQQPTCLGNRLQSVRALMTDLGLTYLTFIKAKLMFIYAIRVQLVNSCFEMFHRIA